MSGLKGEGEQYYAWEGLEPDFTTIPYALCATAQWVLWKAEPKPNGQGMNKIPYQPNGRKAASTRPQEWSTFEECRDAYNEDGADYNGVGFVLSGGDDFIGGDLDHCRDPATGHLTPDAQRIVNGVETYWEVSPSGTGVRFIGRGKVKTAVGEGLEIYGAGRFLTMTGATIGVFPEPLPIPLAVIERLREIAHPKDPTHTVDPDGNTRSNDFILGLIKAKGLHIKDCGDGKHNIVCPWVTEHTGADPTGTVYFEGLHDKSKNPSFHCSHTHCRDTRNIGHVVQYCLGDDAPPTTETEAEAQSFVNGGVPSRKSLESTEQEMDAARLTPTCFVENLAFADVAVLQAPGSTGKTTLVIYEAICMALGIPLYGNKILKTGWTLFVTAEDQRERLLARIREIGRAMELTPEQMNVVRESVIIWDVCGMNLKLTFAQFGNLLVTGLAKEIVAAYKDAPPIVINFDPMVSFGVSEQMINDNEQMIITAARVMVAGLDAMVRLIHHTGKGREGAKGLDMYAGRGGSSLADGARMVFCLSAYLPKDPEMGKPPEMCGEAAPGESLTVMARPKMSYSPPNQPWVWIKRKGFRFSTFDTEPKKSPEEEQAIKEATVLRWLESKLKDYPPSFYNVQALREQHDAMGMTARQLRSAVTGLTASGRVMTVPVPADRNPTGRSTFICPKDLADDFSRHI